MNNKKDFKPFKVGTIFNPIRDITQPIGARKPILKMIEIYYPYRLNAMAIDPSKITENNNLRYSPGEIIIKTNIYNKIKISLKNNGQISVSKKSKRRPLILHAALIMKKALRFHHGLKIEVENENVLKHTGLGSSSNIIAAVASAINEIFGKPIDRDTLIRYVAQNHGEEIFNDPDLLSPVQCIGGSAAAGQYPGAILLLTGENQVISSTKLPKNLKIVIGVPQDYKELDAQTLLKKEIEIFPKVRYCGLKYSREIAYRIVHEVLPALKIGDISPLGDLIFDYRFKMGSIDYCSYHYPRLTKIAKKLSVLKERGSVQILSLSSVGPSFFALGGDTKTCLKIFEKQGLLTRICKIENQPYRVIKKR